MPNAVRDRLKERTSKDVVDRVPRDVTIYNIDLILYAVAIVGHFVDVAVDLNMALRYLVHERWLELGLTVLFFLFPPIVSSAVSYKMYSVDRSRPDTKKEFEKHKFIRLGSVLCLMTPVMRNADALMYALKSRKAAELNDSANQRRYYRLMLKEEADGSLLRVFECFLEAAPQLVLQLGLFMRGDERFTLHQQLSMASSIIGIGWCLAAYQRAIRYAQDDKDNLSIAGSVLQLLWHSFVTMSRVAGLAMLSYLYPMYLLYGLAAHILVMALYLQFYDKTPLCTDDLCSRTGFSLAMGCVYVFTYILPVEGNTRYRYAVFYTICYFENLTISLLWWYQADEDMKETLCFGLSLWCCMSGFAVGIGSMMMYYMMFHPSRPRPCDNPLVDGVMVE